MAPTELDDEAPELADPHWTASIFAVWNLIIRPPRWRYSRVQLMSCFPGPRFKVSGRPVHTQHFNLKNPRGITLACTLFEPEQPDADEGGADRETACVVYCHGNGASRLAGFHLVPLLLSMNIALCCFDFAGSGMSGGQYVSLGHYEKDDLRCVVEHLRRERSFSRIGLWGFSMGAATALMHAARDPSLAGVVADSPFSDLWELLQEVCYHFVRIPALLASPFLHLVRLIIQRKASFDICEVSPRAHVGNCFVPALFLHGDQDDFVKPAHTELLQRSYQGETQRLMMPNKAHAAARSEGYLARATVFLVRALRWEQFLPAGMGERYIARLALGHVQAAGGMTPSGDGPAVPLALLREIDQALRSCLPGRAAYGLTRAACELCGAYNGAKYPLGQTTFSAASPACFAGRVTLHSAAEVALCWVSGCASHEGGRVHFAIISPTTLSFASVSLARLRPSSASRSVAGLVLEAVESLDLVHAQLPLGQPHDVALSVHAGGAELAVGDARLAVRCAVPQGGSVHFCCVQWRQDDGGRGAELATFGCTTEAVMLGSLSPRQRRNDSLEVCMAETLATLCLGSLGPPRRCADSAMMGPCRDMHDALPLPPLSAELGEGL